MPFPTRHVVTKLLYGNPQLGLASTGAGRDGHSINIVQPSKHNPLPLVRKLHVLDVGLDIRVWFGLDVNWFMLSDQVDDRLSLSGTTFYCHEVVVLCRDCLAVVQVFADYCVNNIYNYTFHNTSTTYHMHCLRRVYCSWKSMYCLSFKTCIILKNTFTWATFTNISFFSRSLIHFAFNAVMSVTHSYD